MKQQALAFTILFFGATIGLVSPQRIQAQGTLSVPQRLNINFSPTSGSPGTNQLSGYVNYFQNGWNYDTSSPETNDFDVYITLGVNQATNGWILQRDDYGSLKPIFELTNELYFANSLFPGTPSETYPTYIRLYGL